MDSLNLSTVADIQAHSSGINLMSLSPEQRLDQREAKPTDPETMLRDWLCRPNRLFHERLATKPKTQND